MAKQWFLVVLATLGLAAPAACQMPMPMPFSEPMPMQPYAPMGPYGPSSPMGPMGPMGAMPPMGPMSPSSPMGMQPQGQPMYQPTFADDPKPTPTPEFCPEPGAGPPKDDSPFALPNDASPNAFDDESKSNAGMGFLVNIGAMGLMRQAFGSSKIGFLDTGNNGHTGALPPAGAPAILDYHDISQDMQVGPRGSIQWREDDFGFELVGYYIFPGTQATTLTNPGQITLGFAYFPLPAGFTGNNNLFADADQVRMTYEYTMANVEANFRCRQTEYFEWIVGLRAVYYEEGLNIDVDNSSLETGVVDPTLQAQITTITRSRIVAAQLGCEIEYPLISRFAVGGTCKAGVGANFETTDVTLNRGDGLAGPGVHSSQVVVSQVYEASLFGDILITDQWRIRLGYQALFLVDVPQAQRQVNFDLTNPGGQLNHSGSIFFGGPIVEMQFVF